MLEANDSQNSHPPQAVAEIHPHVKAAHAAIQEKFPQLFAGLLQGILTQSAIALARYDEQHESSTRKTQVLCQMYFELTDDETGNVEKMRLNLREALSKHVFNGDDALADRAIAVQRIKHYSTRIAQQVVDEYLGLAPKPTATVIDLAAFRKTHTHAGNGVPSPSQVVTDIIMQEGGLGEWQAKATVRHYQAQLESILKARFPDTIRRA